MRIKLSYFVVRSVVWRGPKFLKENYALLKESGIKLCMVFGAKRMEKGRKIHARWRHLRLKKAKQERARCSGALFPICIALICGDAMWQQPRHVFSTHPLEGLQVYSMTMWAKANGRLSDGILGFGGKPLFCSKKSSTYLKSGSARAQCAFNMTNGTASQQQNMGNTKETAIIFAVERSNERRCCHRWGKDNANSISLNAECLPQTRHTI